MATAAAVAAQPAFRGYSGSSNCQPLLFALRQTCIRHIKLQNLGGQTVLSLPPKTEELVPGAAAAVAVVGFLHLVYPFRPLVPRDDPQLHKSHRPV